ncbi:hypothetical protein HU200_031369 [Digitaria exilis]|uniref:Peptidyl-tRNA hydrolase n=1 Tax=Digitaria exilis TaxID=1010633 RepID=A0A835ETG9_9POAL|nr:hypothetical protein HU200_031369 [Digitaria exilis]
MSSLATATPTTSAHFSTPTILPSSHTRRWSVAAPLRRARRPRLVTVVASVPDPAAGPVEYTPWLIAGLGNPGNKYYGTRHNVSPDATHFCVGFEMVDRIAREEGIAMNTIQSKSLLGVGKYKTCSLVQLFLPRFVFALRSPVCSIGEVPVLPVKPQSYMNYSGEAVYDDMSLPNGVLRLQRKGGHGRHNGLQNVIENLDGRREFPRLSIGMLLCIGSPPGKMDTRAFLLQKFSAEERVQELCDIAAHELLIYICFINLMKIDTALEQGVDAVRTLVLKGFSGSIERFNLVQKYKFHRV